MSQDDVRGYVIKNGYRAPARKKFLGTGGYRVSGNRKIGYRWEPGCGQKKIYGYRVERGKTFWVPGGYGYQLEIFLSTDEYRVAARKKFWVPIGTGYRSNFQ